MFQPRSNAASGTSAAKKKSNTAPKGSYLGSGAITGKSNAAPVKPVPPTKIPPSKPIPIPTTKGKATGGNWKAPAGSIFSAAPLTGKKTPPPVKPVPKPKPAPAVVTNKSAVKEKIAIKNQNKPAPKQTVTSHPVKLPEGNISFKNPAPKPAPSAPKPVVKPASAPTAPKPAVKPAPAPSAPKPAPSASKTPATTPAGKAVQTNTALSDLWKKANDYGSQFEAALKQGFTYDPQKDAAYKSLEATAQSNAKIASKNAMEDMNDRGILNSTVTSDRMGQIQQSAQDAVTAAIPGLQQNAYSQWMGNINSLHSLWTDTVGIAQNQDNFNENKRQYDSTRADNNSHWQQDFAETQKVNQWNNNNANANIEISRNNSTLAGEDNELAKDKFTYDKNVKEATQAAIGNVLTFKNSKDAYNYLKKNVNAFYQSGVDFNAVLNGISKRFPDVAKKVKADKSFSFSSGK